MSLDVKLDRLLGPNGLTNVVWDMETSDPDDFLCLLILASHPQVNLKAVTITPGSQEQIDLVVWALKELGLPDVPVGGWGGSKPQAVSAWHHTAYGQHKLNYPGHSPVKLLAKHWTEDTTLITGGPVKNLGAFLQSEAVPAKLGRWVAQGGFAGEGVVPGEWQMKKFAGKQRCQTWNFNGDIHSAAAALRQPGLTRLLVGKNICHSLEYDRTLHRTLDIMKGERLEKSRRYKGLHLIYHGMDHYLSKRGAKKFHDPLAACAAIDPSFLQWAEVEVDRNHKEGWGSQLKAGTNTFAAIRYDYEKFVNVFLEF